MQNKLSRLRYVHALCDVLCMLADIISHQMEKYWPQRLRNTISDTAAAAGSDGNVSDALANGSDDENEFDCARRAKVNNSGDGWKLEMKRYIDNPSTDTSKDMDTLLWWQVSSHCTLGVTALMM